MREFAPHGPGGCQDRAVRTRERSVVRPGGDARVADSMHTFPKTSHVRTTVGQARAFFRDDKVYAKELKPATSVRPLQDAACIPDDERCPGCWARAFDAVVLPT